jgi:Flp pilus assembly pilin Flp
MGGDKFWGIMAAIVAVAMVTAVLSSPQASGVIGAIGGAFSGTLRAAMGK